MSPKPFRYASVCDGIGAVHVWSERLGWQCAWTSEIEPFPMAVVDHHYGFPNLGDMTKITEEQLGERGAINLLVGGTPCQSFSVAGLRGGLADPRGNLALRFLQLAAVARPRWLLWENVPGVLSSGGGRDFGSILGGVAELGYGFAFRVLDAQYFRVAQRRRRVFVVGYLGDWRRAAAVLFERDCLSGNPAPSREAGKGIAGGVADSLTKCRAGSPDEARCTANMIPVTVGTITPGAHPGGYNGQDAYTGHLIAHALRAEGFDASEDGTGRGTPLVPVAIRTAQTSANGVGVSEGLAHTLDRANGQAVAFDWQSGGDSRGLDPKPTAQLQRSQVPAVAFQTRIARNGRGQPKDITDALTSCDGGTHADSKPHVAGAFGVRRLTPRECERLQGFPDDYTLIRFRKKPAADGPRYKALGNSMARPVMLWIGQRIATVDAL